MKETKLLSITVFILALSILTGSLFISNAIESRSLNAAVPDEEGLMTQEEAAGYLALQPDHFKDLITTLDSMKQKLTSYSTYTFIPYIVIDDVKYFNKTQLDEWISYNMTLQTEIDTFKAAE